MNDQIKYVTPDDIERRHYMAYIDGRTMWHKHLFSLASAGFTLLISFQNSYVLPTSNSIWLVKICWVSLAISMCFGLLVIFGKAQSPLDAANSLSRIRTMKGDQAAVDLLNSKNGIHFRERWIFRVAEYGFLAAFLSALTSIVWFSSLNIG